MEKCFVIQPFDKGKFDQRYKDSFKSAIENAGVEPYRIDADLSSRIPIEDIEKGIRESTICFADITLDNPNVWYELGFAYACGKDVVMVCSEERVGNFPFDIQHKNVIKYQSRSKSDFATMEEQITNKLKALLKTSQTVRKLIETPLLPHEGLSDNEITLLVLTAENQFTSEDSVGVYSLKSEMGKAGFTDIATGIAIRTLLKMSMVVTNMDSDYNNNQYLVCRVTEKGEDWLLANQDKLKFKKHNKNQAQVQPGEDDDLPF